MSTGNNPQQNNDQTNPDKKVTAQINSQQNDNDMLNQNLDKDSPIYSNNKGSIFDKDVVDATKDSAFTDNDDPPSYQNAASNKQVVPYTGINKVVGDLTDNIEHTEPKKPEYRGLQNQGMTCYLNSVLQTLFMTPEFRKAVYNFKETEKDKEKSIPYQLQKLFISLQFLTDKTAIETVGLTKSFGWEGTQRWQQHDALELIQVMFDALENKLKGTDQEGILDDLYKGMTVDYVKCKHCDYTSKRNQPFTNLGLPIKPFGATESFDTLQKCFSDYTKVEKLEGQNKYFCEKCDSKQDAEKGIQFSKLPYILSIQILRFTFDVETCENIKIGSKCEFDLEMDLKKFVKNTFAVEEFKRMNSENVDLGPSDEADGEVKLMKQNSTTSKRQMSYSVNEDIDIDDFKSEDNYSETNPFSDKYIEKQKSVSKLN